MQNSDDLHQIQLYDMNSPFTVVTTVSCNKPAVICHVMGLNMNQCIILSKSSIAR